MKFRFYHLIWAGLAIKFVVDLFGWRRKKS